MAIIKALLLCSLGLLLPSVQAQTPALQLSQQEVLRVRYALSARFTDGARNCGSNRQVSTGWIEQTEQYWVRSADPNVNNGAAVTAVGGYFQTSTGTFQAPVNGVYYLSGFMRAETSDMDITIRVANNRRCAFGTDLIQRITGDTTNFGGNGWISTGCATVERLNAGNQVVLWYESGATNDCTLDTTFRYGHLNAWLYVADDLPTGTQPVAGPLV